MACYMYTLLAAVHSDKMRLRRFLFYLAKHEGGVMSAWPMFAQHIQQTIVQVAFKEGRGISGSSLFNFFFSYGRYNLYFLSSAAICIQ